MMPELNILSPANKKFADDSGGETFLYLERGHVQTVACFNLIIPEACMQSASFKQLNCYKTLYQDPKTDLLTSHLFLR